MIRSKNKYQHQQFRRHRNHRRMMARTRNPVLLVFRSAKHISAQIIDKSGKILVSAGDTEIKKGNKTERAAQVGELIAKKAKKNKISVVAFDRGQYCYHGRIEALAEAARKGGLKF